MARKDPINLNARIASVILIFLVVINALWVVSTRQSGPLIALLFYSVIILLFWRKRDFRSGAIAGVVGFGIHVYELLFPGISGLEGIYLVFFYMNIILPLPLIFFSFMAYLENK
jgi:hypothetical protein